MRMFARIHTRIFGPKTCEIGKKCNIHVGNETFKIVEKCEEKGQYGPHKHRWKYIYLKK
jgi:hypothetical protein